MFDDKVSFFRHIHNNLLKILFSLIFSRFWKPQMSKTQNRKPSFLVNIKKIKDHKIQNTKRRKYKESISRANQLSFFNYSRALRLCYSLRSLHGGHLRSFDLSSLSPSPAAPEPGNSHFILYLFIYLFFIGCFIYFL